MNLNLLTLPTAILWLIPLCFFTACIRPAPQENQINRIEVTTGYRHGPCQKTAVSIDSTLTYHYYGGQTFYYSPSEAKRLLAGYYTGRVTRAFWDTLNAKLNAIHYQWLDTAYRHSVDDQSLEMIIYYQGKVKHVRAQSGSLPRNVGELIYWIADSYKSVRLSPSKDSTGFHTTEQRPWKNPAKPLFAPGGKDK